MWYKLLLEKSYWLSIHGFLVITTRAPSLRSVANLLEISNEIVKDQDKE
jgi:hypothetical protein